MSLGRPRVVYGSRIILHLRLNPTKVDSWRFPFAELHQGPVFPPSHQESGLCMLFPGVRIGGAKSCLPQHTFRCPVLCFCTPQGRACLPTLVCSALSGPLGTKGQCSQAVLAGRPSSKPPPGPPWPLLPAPFLLFPFYSSLPRWNPLPAQPSEMRPRDETQAGWTEAHFMSVVQVS